jgi:hypothetical protein
MCWTETDLPDGLSALLLCLPQSRVVFDAKTGAVIHDCAWHKPDRPVVVLPDSVKLTDLKLKPGVVTIPNNTPIRWI